MAVSAVFTSDHSAAPIPMACRSRRQAALTKPKHMDIRITDQAIIRLSKDHNIDHILKQLSDHQLETIIAKCREIEDTDSLLESAIWEEMIRRLEFAYESLP